MTTQENIVEVSVVKESEREGFLPAFLGRHFLTFETLAYSYLRRFCASYSGGFWEFYRLSNNGFFMAPTSLDTPGLRLVCIENYFEGDLSYEAAGIVVCLYALNHIACKTGEDRIIELYYCLRELAKQHNESKLICRAID